ncbi:MAG TPA: ankyrin repeat domain-containing protein [Blastocatellia bacterium]|nr:ankyrin repeat domain-containing protein [Blastocatellia bacterium]
MKNRARLKKRDILVVSMLTVLFLGLVIAIQGQDHPQSVSAGQSASVKAPAPEQEDAVRTDLHRAAQAGNLELIRTRLGTGQNPDARDSEGRTPLLEAVKAGQLEATRMLLNAGAGVNVSSKNGRTPLLEAAEGGRNAVARLLIDAGAELDANQRGVGTALEVADREGNRELAVMLRQAGARSSGRSVGDTVCVRPWNGDGYCGVVEEVSKTTFRIRVTELIGCADGCAAKAECSESKPVGSSGGIQVGDVITTVSWCLTHTGVLR